MNGTVAALLVQDGLTNGLIYALLAAGVVTAAVVTQIMLLLRDR